MLIIVIPQYEYNILVITEDAGNNKDIVQVYCLRYNCLFYPSAWVNQRTYQDVIG